MTTPCNFWKPILLAACLAIPSTSFAADKEHPDWPCLQKKVETLAANQVWDGPAIDDLKGWENDETISAIVAEIANRAIPLETSRAKIDAFAKAQDDSSRDNRLTMLFAALFDKLTNERRIMISGIEKYNKRQRERAAVLEDKGKTIAELEGKASSDAAAAEELAKLQEDYDWETRIFKERNENMTVACELPVLVDQRLFDLAREIRSFMKS